MCRILFLLFLLFSVGVIAQSDLKFPDVPKELLKNANSVTLERSVQVEIPNVKTLIWTEHRIVKVYNKNGNSDLKAYAFYDNNSKVKAIEMIVYDDAGEQLEKIRKRDFIDVSAVDGGSLYTDSRALFPNYTPSEYPYIVEFNLTYETNNTAFIHDWYPVNGYFTSTLNSSYQIKYSPGLLLKHKVF